MSDQGTLNILADEILAELDSLSDSDPIHQCGKAALSILKTRPREASQLAKDHIQNQPYREVRGCWLRLYEEASIYQAADLLRDAGDRQSTAGDWMSNLVRVLDLGLIVSGATVRGELYEVILANLEPFLGETDLGGELPSSLQASQPPPLQSNNPVPSMRHPSLEAFQIHLDTQTTPLLLTDSISDWPALQTWPNPCYLLRKTLAGRRHVPVEIGATYTHADWRQAIIPFHQFLHDHLLPSAPSEIGYLGQHNLFRQILSLALDIRTPDYCYASPPETFPPNVSRAPPVDVPQKNVWLGPAGTRTPLHTDPYHNIFCQVMGHKYVRLYPPGATESVYPRGVDENGVDESNTSGVELRFDRDGKGNLAVEEEESFPLFVAQEDYREVIVGPGECLYIPAGWWHYVEALSVSYSVSFWWN